MLTEIDWNQIDFRELNVSVKLWFFKNIIEKNEILDKANDVDVGNILEFLGCWR